MPRLAALLLVAALGCASGAPPPARGAWVHGRSELYAIQITASDWSPIPPDAPEAEGSDLAFRTSPHSAVAVYVYDRSAHSLDELVNSRRKSIEGDLEVSARSEQRELLAGVDLVPVAWTQYRVARGGRARAFYATGVVDTGAKLIEIVAFDNGTGELAYALIRRVVRSIRLLPAAAPLPGSDPT